MAGGKPFQKGDDPRRNAGGRPAIPEDVKEALSSLTLPAVQRLRDLLYSKNDKVALAAAVAILDRNLGKAVQGLFVVTADATPRDAESGADLTQHMTPEELDAVERALLAARRRADAGADSSTQALPASTES